MKLKKLELVNFRAFDQIEIEFADDITVIAGVNGAGKSGALSALAVLLSHALPKFTASQEKSLSFLSADVQLGKTALTASVKLQLEAADLNASIVRPSVIALDEANDLRAKRDALRAAKRFTGKRSNEAEQIDDQIRQIELRLEKPVDVPSVILRPEGDVPTDYYSRVTSAAASQPFAVLYSTGRLLSRLPKRLSPVADVYMASAYTDALAQPEVSLSAFANWFRAVQQGVIQMPAHSDSVLELVESTMNTLLPAVSGLQLHTDGAPQFSISKGGKRLYLWQLSDGEQSLLALALDLFRRLAIANPFTDTPQHGSAIVLIDEIEQHLHPSWQRQVVRQLQSTFKKCQFVVTTHSPQVIGQARPRQLRLLRHDTSGRVVCEPVRQSFGMDSSWVLQHIMGVPARDYGTEQALSAIYEAIDHERFDDARAQAEQLREEIGDFPDLQEAIALLDRFDLLRVE